MASIRETTVGSLTEAYFNNDPYDIFRVRNDYTKQEQLDESIRLVRHFIEYDLEDDLTYNVQVMNKHGTCCIINATHENIEVLDGMGEFSYVRWNFGSTNLYLIVAMTKSRWIQDGPKFDDLLQNRRARVIVVE